MRLVTVGLSHHTAPLNLREQLAVSTETVPGLLEKFRADRIGSEAVLLSTCNRVELYAVPMPNTAPEKILGWLARTGGMRLHTLKPHAYFYSQEKALKHLFRVTASLDSMVVGEGQILGQVRSAYRLAAQHESTGPILRRVMDRALNVAKKVHSETGIAREAVSVGRAGVELASQVIGTLEGRSALLIGAGAHGKLVARAMLSRGLGELVVASRTFQRAMQLADLFGGSAVHLDELDRYLKRVDVVVTSTAAGRILIDQRRLAAVVRKRRYKSLVMIDLSVPRNIDPEVNRLGGVFCFDVDDLKQLADAGMEKRRAAAAEAERIVDGEVARCWRMFQGETVGEGIGAVVRSAEKVRTVEMARAQNVLATLTPQQRNTVDAMTRAIVKKVLHPPVSQMRTWAEEGQSDKLDALLEAFKGTGLTSQEEPRDDESD